MKGLSPGRVGLVVLVVALVAAAFWSGVGEIVSIDTLKVRQTELARLVETRPLAIAAAYLALYAGFAALSIPGAAVMTLAGGAVFGLVLGTILVSFASVLGAVLAFLGSRYLFRGWVERRFGRRLAAIDRGLERDGALYLLSLRLNPAFPYFLVNLAMGLTRMGVLKFALISQIGIVLFDGFAFGMLLFVLSVGLSVTLGLMNFINLAHCAFGMLGGYVAVTAMRQLGLPFLASLSLAFFGAAATDCCRSARHRAQARLMSAETVPRTSKPSTTLSMTPEESARLRKAYIDEWLAATSGK